MSMTANMGGQEEKPKRATVEADRLRSPLLWSLGFCNCKTESSCPYGRPYSCAPRTQKAPRVGTEQFLFLPQLEPDGLLVWVLASALGLSLVFSLVSVPLQCFQISKAYGLCLLLFYFCFLVVVLLTEFGVIHLKKV